MFGAIRALLGGISAAKMAAIGAIGAAVLLTAGWAWWEIRSQRAENARLNRELGATAIELEMTARTAVENAEALARKVRDHDLTLLTLTRRAERAEIAYSRLRRIREEVDRAKDADQPIPDALMPFTGGDRVR